MKILITEDQYKNILLESNTHFTWVLRVMDDKFSGVVATFTNPIGNGKNYSMVKKSQMYSPVTKKSTLQDVFWSTTDKPPYVGVSDVNLAKKLNNFYMKKFKEDYKTSQSRRDPKSPYKDSSNSPVKYQYSVDYERNKKFLKDQGMLGWDSPAVSAPQHFNISAYMSFEKINRWIFENRFQNGKGEGTINNCFGLGLMSNKSNNGLRYDIQFIDSYDYDSFQRAWGKFRGKDGVNNDRGQISGQPSDFNDMYWGFYSADIIWGNQFMTDIKNNSDNSTYYSKDGWYNLYTQLYAEPAGTTSVNGIISKIQGKPSPKGCGLYQETKSSFSNWTWQDWMTTFQIITSFIPGAGPFVAAGLGGIESMLLYTEGKNTEATVTLALSLIPFVSKIPAVKAIPKQTITNITTKTRLGQTLNSVEQKAVKTMNQYKDKLNGELSKYIQNTKKSNSTVIALSKYGKDQLKTYVKDKLKNTVGGEYSGYLTRSKEEILTNTLNTYKEYLRKQGGVIDSDINNFKPGSIKTIPSKKFFYYKSVDKKGGDTYYWKQKGVGSWNYVQPMTDTYWKIRNSWSKLQNYA